jgi:enolase-phosphatase E1
VLLDIEGTTTPIAFVHEVLFPYARAHMSKYLKQHWSSQDVRRVRRRLAEEQGRLDDTEGREAVEAYALWLMDRDRKSPGLKLLQGLIWEDGYQAGVLRGQVFEDVPGAMRTWKASGIDIAIYSSGSELAQRRLFQSSESGDLSPLVTAFFDTGVGAKVEPESYTQIVAALQRQPPEILFVSDVVAELAAAKTAGLAAVLSHRPGNPAQPAHEFETITSLAEIEP